MPRCLPGAQLVALKKLCLLSLHTVRRSDSAKGKMRDACKRAGLELRDKTESLLMGLVRGVTHGSGQQVPQLDGHFRPATAALGAAWMISYVRIS